MPDSPIKEITFGEGMKFSLNNYYDVLKEQAGGLAAKEFIQLKLVADGLDISDTVKVDSKDASYKWFSYYNLVKRSDIAIDPDPVDIGTVMTGAKTLHAVYEEFLRKLKSLVALKNLSVDDQRELADIETLMKGYDDDVAKLEDLDKQQWNNHCSTVGLDPKDIFAYLQWSANNGQKQNIKDIYDKKYKLNFRRLSILDKSYSNPDEKEIIDAVADFENPNMSLRYPLFPDYEYLPQVVLS